MNYIGSKFSLLDFLEKSIAGVAGRNSNRTFCDLFAGTGAVGAFFKKQGYSIISNDIQYYSYVLNRHIIVNNSQLEYNGLPIKADKNRQDAVFNFLNNLEGIEGFVFNNYCPNKDNKRQYFTVKNGKKCDAVRQQIEEWKIKNKINENEYFSLLAALLEAADKVANTASVYGAFLKKYKKSSLKSLELSPLKIIGSDKEHKVYNNKANELIKDIKADILYLDPPYNQRQYAANYHVLETIARYDNPDLSGYTGLRDYETQKSKYCVKREVKREFEGLIEKANAKYIFLSYNNEGLLTQEDICQILSKKGEYGFFEKEYARYKADSNRQQKSKTTNEYLYYLILQ